LEFDKFGIVIGKHDCFLYRENSGKYFPEDESQLNLSVKFDIDSYIFKHLSGKVKIHSWSDK